MMAIFPQDDYEWTDEQKKAKFDVSTSKSNSSGCSVKPMVSNHPESPIARWLKEMPKDYEYADRRISFCGRWLYWDSEIIKWVVREINGCWSESRVLIETEDEALAVKTLSDDC